MRKRLIMSTQYKNASVIHVLCFSSSSVRKCRRQLNRKSLGGFVKNISYNLIRGLKNLNIILLLVFINQINSQDMEVDETNQFGLKDTTPSIIIDENSFTGDYEVYSVNKFGLKNISPDEIIENDEYSGTWNVYRINNFGLKDIIPEQVAEENSFDSSINIYDVNSLGLKDISPSTIIEKDGFSGDIELYNVNDFGLKELSPFEVIKKEGNQYNVYSINKMGLPDIFPTRIIEIKENPTVFGILLLPSIKQITFDPGHTRIKTIQRIKNIPEKTLKEEGWLKSKPKLKVDKP